jgi:hypothetical protein
MELKTYFVTTGMGEGLVFGVNPEDAHEEACAQFSLRAQPKVIGEIRMDMTDSRIAKRMQERSYQPRPRLLPLPQLATA